MIGTRMPQLDHRLLLPTAARTSALTVTGPSRSVAPMATPAGPLGELRVLEWTGTRAGAFAGWLLRELGATVVHAGAAPTTWAPGERVLHRGKHAVTDADATTLLPAADVVLVDEHAPWRSADAARGVSCDVSAWGAYAPQPPLPPDDALVSAATAVFASQWSWSKRPVWMVTPMVSYMTGMLAAFGAVAAHYVRLRGGPAQRVSVSGLQAAFALNSGTYVTGPKHTGSLLDSGEPRGVYPTYALYRTADGWLFVGALTDAFWVNLAMTIDRADLLAEPRLQGGPLTFGSPAVRAFVRAELEPIFVMRSTAAWVDVLRAADVPCGAVQTRAEFLHDPEARALHLATPIDDPVLGATWQAPAPAVFSDTPTDAIPPAAIAHGPAPAWTPRAANPGAVAPSAVFAGLRVLDVTSFIAGPVCPMLLADLGADVIKIESAQGDPFRYAAFAFVGWNRGKRSIVLDLRHPDGQAAFRDLARTADVLVDNVRAGVLDRLGIGFDVLAAENPRLIHLSITGFGSDGPLTHLPGFDPVFQSRGGLMHAQGGDDEPVFHTLPYNDYCAGTLGALAVAAALVARERTGRGQRVGVSLFRTALVDVAAEMLLADGAPLPALGGRDFLGPSAAERLYHCRDGWICVAARTAAERSGLAAVTGESVAPDAAAEGPAGWAIAAWCAARDRDDALGHLSALGVPAVPCLAFADLWRDPLLRASGTIAEGEDPVLGQVLQSGPFIGFDRTPVRLRGSAPQLGADGAEVLAGIGYTAERIAALVAAGVLGDGTGTD